MTNRLPEQESLIGLKIDHGRYEIIKLIGEGGMGRVFQARQVSMNRMVALKILRAQMAADESLLARFQQEALSVSRLRHPNTITCYDYGRTEDDHLFISMELLGGQSLFELMRTVGPLPPERALHIMEQVAGSVAEAHMFGIVHRDLKPENIQIDNVGGDSDFAKVLDFGIAKIIQGDTDGETDQRLTMAGSIFGTPHYMSPEQVHGQRVDHRTDIYSLGIILYEMLSGESPYDGPTPMAVMMAQASKPIPDLRERFPELNIPDGLAELVISCMMKEREERLGTVNQMIRRMRELRYALGDVPTSRLPFEAESGPRPLPRVGARLGAERASVDTTLRASSRPPAAEPARLSDHDLGAAAPESVASEETPLDSSLLALPAGSGPPLTRVSRDTPTPSLDRHADALRTPEHTGHITPIPPRSPVDTMPPRGNKRGLQWALAGLVLVGGLTGGYFALQPATPSVPASGEGAGGGADAPGRIVMDFSTRPVTYTIASAPAGAEIYEHGKLLGEAPQQLSWPEGTKTTLTLRLDGYEDAELKLTAREGGETALTATLEKRGARPKAPPRTGPGALGVPGPGPKPLEPPPTVDPDPEGADPVEGTVEGEPARQAWVSFESTPPGASVHVGDALIGTTPFEWRPPLTPGAVQVRISKEGHKSVNRTLRLKSAGKKATPVKLRLRADRPRGAAPAPSPNGGEETPPTPTPTPDTPTYERVD